MLKHFIYIRNKIFITKEMIDKKIFNLAIPDKSTKKLTKSKTYNKWENKYHNISPPLSTKTLKLFLIQLLLYIISESLTKY